MADVFDVLFDPVGESRRLDTVIRKHEQLRLEVQALVRVLIERGLLTEADAAHLVPSILAEPEIVPSD